MGEACVKDETDNGIAGRLAAVRERLAAAAAVAGTPVARLTLVAVTKTVGVAAVQAAHTLGVTEFGENRVQEAQGKVTALPQARWHLIGHLQSNKARLAVQLFPVIQSVDSIDLARRLSRIAGELGKTPEVFAQVNTSGEASKSGMAPEAVDEFFAAAGALPHLRWRGLMTIGPLCDDERTVRAAFARLRACRDDAARQFPALALTELSMGMTDDYHWAIAEGATVVRIGRALFGDRG